MEKSTDTLDRIHPQLRALALPIGALNEDPANANAHNDASLAGISASFIQFGQRKPVVVRREGMVVEAGNGTLAALRAAGWTHLACVVCDDSEDTAKAYAIADNLTAQRASWNMEQLATNVGELLAADYDIGALCFSDEDLAQISDRTWAQPSAGGEPSDPSDQSNAPEPAGEAQDNTPDAPTPEPPEDPITQPGDLITLGDHRLICGSCRDPEVVARLLEGEKVNVAFTSPPYASQRKYDESSGFKPIKPDDYVDWFEAVQANVREHLAEDGSWFVNIKEHCEDGERHLYVKDLTIAHKRRWGWKFKDELVWKHHGKPGRVWSTFKNQWEPVFHFATQTHVKCRPLSVAHKSEHVPQGGGGELKQHQEGKSIAGHKTAPGMAYPGNVITITGSDGGHPAAFPIALPTFFIKAYSDEGDVIYDPFMGSGTVIIAGERLKRRGRGNEISPRYCDVIVQRWEKETGRKAVRESLSGEVSEYAFAVERRKPARDGDQDQARRRVQTLVDNGRLKRPEDVLCTDCGEETGKPAREYDHYLGYDGEHHEHVQAVCAGCHHAREAKRVADAITTADADAS